MAVWCYYLSDGSNALNPGGFEPDGSPTGLGSTATYDPIILPKGLWTRSKPLPQIQHTIVLNKMKR